MFKQLSLVLSLVVLAACNLTGTNITKSVNEKLNVLIIDGQNNHVEWPKTTMSMKAMLEKTGRFDVDVERTKYTWKASKFGNEYPLSDGKAYQDGEPKTDPDFAPNFSYYDVVISNFGWRAADWPKSTQESFEGYMKNGGGLVVVHAADNSFPNWQAFNEMIGLGGWGGRNEKSGPYVYYDDEGNLHRDHSKGSGGGHGKQHEFKVVTRVDSHPITEGMPAEWMHFKDELYNRLRGPANNLTVLATAFDDPKINGSGRHEPVLMTIDYYKGRVFHSTLGHHAWAMKSPGFITTLVRGTEWAGSGKVTLPVHPEM